MKGKHKKFEQGVYDLYDGPAKEAIAVHLRGVGHTVTVPPEDYGPDLYSYWGLRKCYHEVEVSLGWEQGSFPYPGGSIPERKKRLTTKVGDCELFFWMLRRDLKAAMTYAAAVAIDDQWLVEVSNKKIVRGEYFYRVPYKLGKEFDLLC